MEQATRNAIRLLETIEDIDDGLRKANELMDTMDPISPLIGSIQSLREDFIKRKANAERKRTYLLVGGGLIALILLYFLFDLLYGIYQSKQRCNHW